MNSEKVVMMSEDLQSQINALQEQNSTQARQISIIFKRVSRLEYEAGLTQDEEVLKHYEEQDLTTIEDRIHKLETASVATSLGVEAELSGLERILCGLEPEPSDSEASKQRAVALGRLWQTHSDSVGDREILNVKRHKIKSVLSRELTEDISSKQLKRAMEAFEQMMQVGDTRKARINRGTNGANQIIIDHPEDVVWTAEALKERFADE